MNEAPRDVEQWVRDYASREQRRAGPDLGHLFGPYRVEAELGSGGQAVVYRALDTRLGRSVALKLLIPRTSDIAAFFLRFKRESEAASRVAHPNLCTVYEAGVEGGQPYIAMAYIDGTPLSEVIADPGQRDALTLDEKLALVEQVASGTDAAHRAGLVHRDIKPANILLATSGRPVLVDFGMARSEFGDHAGATQTGDLRGTPAYMAPEQVLGQRHADHRCDVHALGVVLYELLEGRRPFTGATMSALFQEILRSDPTRPSRMPADLWVVLQTALAKEPAQRYARAADLAEDLRRVRAREPILARPLGPMRRSLRWVRRHPALASVLGLVLLGSVVFAAWRAQAADRLAAQAERAERARDEAVRRAYLANIHAAYGALAMHDAGEAERHLAACPEPLRGWAWHHLATACNDSLRSVAAHGGTAFALAVSPDGAQIATGGHDGVVRLWDAEDCTPAGALHNPEGEALLRVAFSPDGTHVVGGGALGSVFLWQCAGTYVGRLHKFDESVWSVAFAPDGRRLFAGSDTFELASCSLDPRTPATVIQPELGVVRALLVDPGGRSVIFGTNRGAVRRYDLATDAVTEVCDLPGQVWSMEGSADGTRALVGLADGTARLIRLEDGEEVMCLRGHGRRVTGAAHLPGGLAATTSLDGALRIWELATGRLLHEFVGHRRAPLSVAWSPRGAEVVSIGYAGTLHAWVPGPSPARTRSTQLFGWPRTFDFHPAGRIFAIGGRGRRVVLGDSWSGEALQVVPLRAEHACGVAFSEDGRHLVVADRSGRLQVREAASNDMVRVHELGCRAWALALTPAGQIVAAAGDDGVVRAWSLASGAPTHVWPVAATRQSRVGASHQGGGTLRAAAVRLLRESASIQGQVAGV